MTSGGGLRFASLEILLLARAKLIALTMDRADAIAAVEAEFSEATSRAWNLVRSTDARLFTVRPNPASWSAAECLAHLTIASEMFLPPLHLAIEEVRSRGGRSDKPPKMDVVGRVMRWFLEPPMRKRVQTTAPLVPRSIRAKSEAFGQFAALQEKLIELLRSGRGLDLDKARIVSPFDTRVKYNAFSAFRIIVAHQRRHLWQAEHAIAALRANSPA